MEAIVEIVGGHDPATELRTLRSALLFEESLRGRVAFRPESHAGGARSGEALVITLGVDGAAAALTRGLSSWMQHRGDPRLRVRLTVDIEAGELASAAAELPTLLEPAAVAGDLAPRPGAAAERERLAARVESALFRKPPRGRRGYDEDDVDAFLDMIVNSLRSGNPMDPAEVRGTSFGKPPFGKRGYDETAVDDLLDELQVELRKLRA